MTQPEMTKSESINLAAIAVDGIQLVKEIWVGVTSREDLIRQTSNFFMGVDRIIRAREEAKEKAWQERHANR